MRTERDGTVLGELGGVAQKVEQRLPNRIWSACIIGDLPSQWTATWLAFLALAARWS